MLEIWDLLENWERLVIIWANDIPDNVLFLFLSLGWSWRQFWCASRSSSNPAPGGALWLQSSISPTCKVLMICSVSDLRPQSRLTPNLHPCTHRDGNPREVETEEHLSLGAGWYFRGRQYSWWLLWQSGSHTTQLKSQTFAKAGCSLYERWLLLGSCQPSSSERTRMP